MMSPVLVRSPVSYFMQRGGPAIHIRPFSTEDLLFFAEFREKLEMTVESTDAAPHATASKEATLASPPTIPTIPRAHPKFGDRLTLVAYRNVSENHRSILGAAQLYPSALGDHFDHAEAVILIESGSRDSGLETELLRWLLELAREVRIQTVELLAYPAGNGPTTLYRRHIRVPDGPGEPISASDEAISSVA